MLIVILLKISLLKLFIYLGEVQMKTILKTALIFALCIIPQVGLGIECSDLSQEIQKNRNDKSKLKELSARYPHCGEIWEALGDYFYSKKLWNEAEENYEKASRLLPNKKSLISRLEDVRSRTTTLVRNEQDLLKYRRGLGGATAAGPGLRPDAPTNVDQPSIEPVEPPVDASASRKEAPAEKIAAATGKKKQAAKKRQRVEPKPKPAQSAPELKPVGLMIHFDYNSAKISPEGEKLLDGFADVLNKELAGRSLHIVGHTDNIGGPAFNLRLSLERATSVREYLSQHGIDSNRLKIIGYGLERPIYDNDTEEGRSKNRRVEFQEIIP
jgi:outer membrane protein OmpA-like peptidoglycan-associated protein